MTDNEHLPSNWYRCWPTELARHAGEPHSPPEVRIRESTALTLSNSIAAALVAMRNAGVLRIASVSVSNGM